MTIKRVELIDVSKRLKKKQIEEVKSELHKWAVDRVEIEEMEA
jgi:hypothetical protein